MNSQFGEFLYRLRREKGLTQQELADMVGITNKAVSKWETGESYPETALLIPLAEIFGITVDELLRGEKKVLTDSCSYEQTEAPFFPVQEERQEVDNSEKEKAAVVAMLPVSPKEAVLFGLGVGIILFGLIAMFVIMSQDIGYGVYIPVPLGFIAVAVFIFTFTGMNRAIRSADTDEATARQGRKYAAMISSGIAVVLIAVAVMVALVGKDIEYSVYLPVLFAILTPGIFLVVTGGIMWDGFVKKYNIPTEDASDIAAMENGKRAEVISGGICGCIMLVATAVFLLMGFIGNLWKISWVAFPIGGILCGIISTVFNMFGKK